MSNILKKVMSLGNLSRAASPTPIERNVDTQNPTAIGMAPIPNFADEGVTDHTAILMELLPGPTVAVLVGTSQTLVAVPKRLLIYHFPVAATLLATHPTPTATDTLTLPDDDPLIFLLLCRWMYQDNLGIVDYCTRAGIPDACALLCRIFVTASFLAIPAVQDRVLEELAAAFAAARTAGHITPLRPSTVMQVWVDDGDDGLLWEVVLKEMCTAFSRKPLPLWEEYDDCARRIDPFRLKVAKAMADCIVRGHGGVDGVKFEG